MPGILPVNQAYGIDATQQYGNAAIMQANNSMYNQDIRRQNLQALGNLVVSGGKAGLKTAQAAHTMQLQNTNTPVQQDTAQSGSDGTVGQSQPNSGGLSGSQISSLFGKFFSAFQGSGGGGS
jgi:hypothetical protein